jgi:hypothetical protein
VQITIRLPRFAVTAAAILVAAVTVVALLPASASSDSVTTFTACVDPTTQDLTFSACGGSVITWNQAGTPGAQGATGATGAAGATGPAGAAGAAGPATHLDKSKPALVAKIQTALAVQGAVLTDINGNVRDSLATAKLLAPSADPAVAVLQHELAVEGSAEQRLVNVMRALSKAQALLLQGLQ